MESFSSILFFGILTVVVLVRLALRAILPWRILSTSTMNLAGFTLFILLGLAIDTAYSTAYKACVALGLYSSILVGELVASRVKTPRVSACCSAIMKSRSAQGALIVAYIIGTFGLLGMDVLLSPRIAVFGQGDIQRLLELRGLEAASDSGLSIGIGGLLQSLRVQAQFIILLGLGICLMRFRTFVLVSLLLYSGLLFASNPYGARSPFAIYIAIFALGYGITTKRKFRAAAIAVGSALFLLLTLRLALDLRSGTSSTEETVAYLESTMEKDFAYGGIALDLKQSTATVETAERYLIAYVCYFVPRVLWTEKPYIQPNAEMTEFYTAGRITNVALFSPLGEALFYFSYPGIAIIGILYGFTSGFLERLYLSSELFLGNLIYLFVWTFLGYRHTYYNLFIAVAGIAFYPILFMACVDTLVLRASRALPSSAAVRVDERVRNSKSR